MFDFKNKTIIITGGARGIGRQTALEFAKSGANVVVTYLSSKEKAESLGIELNKLGSKSMVISCDVTKEDDVDIMVKIVLQKYNKIDVLVNNAGYVNFMPILDRTPKDWIKTLDINLVGPFICTKAISRHMLANRSGKIVNISSTSGINTFDHNIADYDAAKAGLITLTKNFAKALSPYIHVNTVAPGWVDTEMNADLSDKFISNEKQQIYLKRFGNPIDIANAILFLSSDKSDYITGSVLVIDGGHD